MTEPLLAVRNLRVGFADRTSGLPREVLCGVDLEIRAGEALALVGPSGSGKSLTARAVVGLLPAAARWQGEILWNGRLLRDPDGADWAAVRGPGATLVLQEPAAALDPVATVGGQIAEVLRHHRRLGRDLARGRAVELLAEVGIGDPRRAARSYPHELSGGMRQRALLASALACDPRLLIADEITSSLDAGTRAGVLALLDRIRRDRGMALLFITHDVALVPLVCDRCARLEHGRIVSVEPAQTPASPSVRACEPDAEAGAAPVLKARGLVGGYRRARAPVIAGVDLDLRARQALGLAGESGCGKTTLARLLARHLALRSGTLELGGEDFLASRGARLRRARRRVQVLFQDPGGTLNPRQRIVWALREAAGPDPGRPSAATDRGLHLMAETGLAADLAERLPHELSGGQKQRAALARCLAADPLVLIADEPTSNLDAQAAQVILALLRRTMTARGLGLLLISHDLNLLLRECDRIAVMIAGTIVEMFPAAAGRARHPYTLMLLGSDAQGTVAAGQPLAWTPEAGTPKSGKPEPGGPRLGEDARGCPFAARCPLRKPACQRGMPPVRELGPGHWLRCPEVP